MLLRLESVNAYYDKSHVLQDVSLEVDKGEVVALLGRNGSGRSTTLKTIMGLVTARTGKVFFHDRDVTNALTFTIAKQGIAFRARGPAHLPNLTVAENLRLAGLAGRKGPWNEARIYDPSKSWANGAISGPLSGGEQQMLAIARALIANPEIILLDEPMEGLAR